jgi:hypothetical protein
VVSPAFANSTTGYKLKSRRDSGVKSCALGFGLASGIAAALEILVTLGVSPREFPAPAPHNLNRVLQTGPAGSAFILNLACEPNAQPEPNCEYFEKDIKDYVSLNQFAA